MNPRGIKNTLKYPYTNPCQNYGLKKGRNYEKLWNYKKVETRKTVVKTMKNMFFTELVDRPQNLNDHKISLQT